MHLYQLAEQYNTILDTEDLTDEQIVEHLDNIQAQFKDKVINIGKVIITLLANAKATEEEVKRLTARQKSLEHKAEWLKGYLLDNLVSANVKRVDGEILSVSLKDNPPSIKIIDQDKIPQEFRKIIPESWLVDKRGIIANFATTGEIPNGVEIITDKKSVVIR